MKTKKLLMGLLVLSSSACSILPGLQMQVPGQSDASPITVRNVAPGEDLIEVSSPNSLIKTVRVLALSPEVLAQQKSIPAKVSESESALLALEKGPSDYLIGVGDILGIVVWDHPELTNPKGEYADAVSSGRLVGADGNIFYPYIGNFKVTGLSLTDLRTFISKKLEVVITKPQVDVRVVSFRSQRVQITGEVTKPGQLLLDDVPKTLMQALAESGGVTTNGSKRRALLYRGNQQYEIDLASLYSGKSPGFNPTILPGDRIHIPERNDEQVFVLGQVGKEGPVYFSQQNMTLIEVLAQSGGLEKLSSNARNILVFRRPEPGEEVATVIRADLSNPLGLLAAGELPMHSRDVVYVSTTALGKLNLVINNLLPSIQTIFQLDALINRSR